MVEHMQAVPVMISHAGLSPYDGKLACKEYLHSSRQLRKRTVKWLDTLYAHITPRIRHGYSPKLQGDMGWTARDWPPDYRLALQDQGTTHRMGNSDCPHNRKTPYKGDNGPSQRQEMQDCGLQEEELQKNIRATLNAGSEEEYIPVPTDYALAHCVAQGQRMSNKLRASSEKKPAS